MNAFPCDKCGLCCRRVNRSELADKDGVCKYLDETSSLCSIYERRPIFCRVDEYYERFYKDAMSLEEFYRLNLSYCREIKKYWQEMI